MSEEILTEKFVSIELPKSNDPWSSISQIIQCRDCKKKIPAHLGERWNDITLKHAKEEFKNLEMYQAIEARAEILATEKWMKKQGDLKSLN